MPIQHVIADTDTLESISDNYFGNPDKKQDIIDYNRLDYPYIVNDRSEVLGFYASGYLHIVRSASGTTATIKAGSTFGTKPQLVGGMVKTYEVIEDTACPAGQADVYVFVRSQVAGVFGNELAGSITEVLNLVTVGYLGIASVTNDAPFNNGRVANVKAVGDLLYIPSEGVLPVKLQTPVNLSEYLDELGQEDILVDVGELKIDGSGDIASVKGIDNIIQAIIHRLMTERGEYPLHPSFGVNLPIGAPQLPYIEKLAELDIMEALAQEDRIQDAQLLELTKTGTAVEILLTFRPAGAGEGVNYEIVKLRLNYGGGQ